MGSLTKYITLPTTKPSERTEMLGKTIQIKTMVNRLGEDVCSLPVVNCKFQFPTVWWGEKNVSSVSIQSHLSKMLYVGYLLFFV